MQTVYVVYTEQMWEGIQEIESVWGIENDAKARVIRLNRVLPKGQSADYIEMDVSGFSTATTATPEPGSASANELQA